MGTPVIESREEDLAGEPAPTVKGPRGKFALLAEEDTTAAAPPTSAGTRSAVAPGKFALLAAESAEEGPAARVDRALQEGAMEVGRQVGLTARAAARGATAVPAVLANAPAGAYNAAADFYERITGRPRGFRFPDQSRLADWVSDKVALPAPANALERVVGDAASGMAGQGALLRLASFVRGSASPTAAAVGESLSAGPGTQLVAGGVGGGAAASAREAGAGPLGQAAAGVGGALSVAAGPATGAELVRRFGRGGEGGRQAMRRNIETFEDAGTSPSLGQATGNRVMQAIESGLAKVPGGAGVMARTAEREAEEMGRRVDQLANQVMPNASAARAGASIERGIRHFVDWFKAEQDFLYSKLDAHIRGHKQIKVENTKQALEELNADIPGAPNLSQWFKNAKIQGIEGALVADTSGPAAATRNMPLFQLAMLKTLPMKPSERAAALSGFADGLLPYEAVKKLRTLVGRELESTSLASDVPRSKWKALYAALSEDLGEAARETGPAAEKAFRRANAFSSAGYGRIETFLDRVAGKDTVENVFRAAVNPAEIREGASTLNAVMRSIPAGERKMVTAAVLRRMGVANPGAQDETGAVFSAQTFLTNWAKMSEPAKVTLFGGSHSPGLMRDLDQVAKAASAIREGSKVFANPSGTTQAAANVGGGLAVALSAGHGNFGAAGLLLGGMAMANVTARMMTNPNMVHWFARATKAPAAAAPTMLNELTHLGARSKDPALRDDVDAYLTAARSELGR